MAPMALNVSSVTFTVGWGQGKGWSGWGQLQTAHRKPQTAHHKPQTTNYKPQISNHKLQTTNYKPPTSDHESVVGASPNRFQIAW